MGEVYRARDTRLEREVAVKVLPPHLSFSEEMRQRFEREARAVAALSHPNILAIHDFGSHGGVSYAVMELLEGETLRGKLVAGLIPQRQAMDYALQIARGLWAAHEKGIVHRDLKPENLFITKDGQVKILDFGLAKRVERVSPDGETSAPTASAHTEPGRVMGTAGYMSPEQVRGLPIDHRSDIFSFGAILYELLSGRKAFQGNTAADTMSAIMRDEAPDLTESGRNIPVALDHIVRHCLEKGRDDRFQTAKDVAFALSEASSSMATGGMQAASTLTSGPQATSARAGAGRVLFAVAVLVVLVVASAFFLRRLHRGAGAAGAVKRVAVLPFENLGSPEDDYFADGITDEVRGKLTSLPGLQVIARSSSTPYRKTPKSPKQIAEELEATYLLTATVRWERGAGGTSRVHVSPELVEVPGSGQPTLKWQQPFDAALTDVFQVQADIAGRVAGALSVALEGNVRHALEEKPTQNLAAYDAFLRGNAAWVDNTVPNIRRALAAFEQAVALDSTFALAWAGLARAHAFLYYLSTPTPTEGDVARQAAERAIALAPERPEGHRALGAYYSYVVVDNQRALAADKVALSLAPGDANAVRDVAGDEQSLGHYEAARVYLEQAMRLDPRSARAAGALGYVLLYTRRYPEAHKALDQSFALAPPGLDLLLVKAAVFVAQGDLPHARAVLQAAPKTIEPAALVAWFAEKRNLGWILDDAQQALLLQLTPSAFDGNRAQWGLALATACWRRGDSARARAYADSARLALEERLRAAPGNAGAHLGLGIALAYLGQEADAVREGEHAASLMPLAKDANMGPSTQLGLVRIYLLVNEPEKALDHLEPLLKIPYYLSPGWLRIDPTFDSLRGNPRFQKLVADAK
jgi:TolB-like protein/Flp pilus assembly protein TadD